MKKIAILALFLSFALFGCSQDKLESEDTAQQNQSNNGDISLNETDLSTDESTVEDQPSIKFEDLQQASLDGFEYFHSEGDYFVVYDGSSYGVVDAEGYYHEIVLPVESIDNLAKDYFTVYMYDARAMNTIGSVAGIVNAKGEVVIEPKYKNIIAWEDDVFIAQTIEEDRDDLKNSRLILVDKTDKETAEILSKGFYSELLIRDPIFGPTILMNVSATGSNDEIEIYIYSYNERLKYSEEEKDTRLVIDKNGKKYDIKSIINNLESDYQLNGYYFYESTFEPSAFKQYHLKEASSKDLSNYPLEVQTEGIFLTAVDNNYSVLNMHDGSFISTDIPVDDFDYTIAHRYGSDDFIIVNSNDNQGTVSYYFFEESRLVKELVAPDYDQYTLSNSIQYYWEKSEEYYKLVSIDGEVIIGEDQKVTEVDDRMYDTNKYSIFKYRPIGPNPLLEEAIFFYENKKLIPLY